MVKSIAIVGGSSDIAKSTISSMSADNYKFHVLVRDDSHTDELSASGVSVVWERLSLLVNKHENVLDAFAGVAPFSISVAMRGCKVTSLDSNP